MTERIIRCLQGRLYLLYITLLLLTLVTLGLTLLPPEQISGPSLFEYDKIGHALLFGSWTFFLGLLLLVSGQRPLPLLAIFLAGSLFGISVEILQDVLPFNRNMDPYDAIADVVGCLVAVAALWLIDRRIPEDF